MTMEEILLNRVYQLVLKRNRNSLMATKALYPLSWWIGTARASGTQVRKMYMMSDYRLGKIADMLIANGLGPYGDVIDKVRAYVDK